MFLRAGDTISGSEGKATANIGGNIHDLFFIKSLEATMEKQKTPIKVLGRRGEQHKAVGWSGTGSMTIYYVTSLFRELALKYIKTGQDTYFNITVVNDDPTSTIGRQTVVLYNCNIDSTVLAKLDTDSDALDEELTFTYDDCDILDRFGNPVI